MAPKANNASAGVGRAKTDVTDSQIGFIEFIVLPIWQAIAPLLPILSDEVLHNLKENLNFWKSGAAKKFFGPGFLKRPSTPSPWTSSTSVGLSYGNQGSPLAARAYNRRGTIDGSTDTSAARNELCVLTRCPPCSSLGKVRVCLMGSISFRVLVRCKNCALTVWPTADSGKRKAYTLTARLDQAPLQERWHTE